MNSYSLEKNLRIYVPLVIRGIQRCGGEGRRGKVNFTDVDRDRDLRSHLLYIAFSSFPAKILTYLFDFS